MVLSSLMISKSGDVASVDISIRSSGAIAGDSDVVVVEVSISAAGDRVGIFGAVIGDDMALGINNCKGVDTGVDIVVSSVNGAGICVIVVVVEAAVVVNCVVIGVERCTFIVEDFSFINVVVVVVVAGSC